MIGDGFDEFFTGLHKDRPLESGLKQVVSSGFLKQIQSWFCFFWCFKRRFSWVFLGFSSVF